MHLPVLDLLPCAIAAIGLAATTWIFVLLNAQIRKNSLRSERQRQALEAAVGLLKTSLDELRSRVEEAPPGNVEPALPRPRPSLNLNHRAQVLRMSRRGERVEQVAAAIGIPQREVELLLKVHQATVAALA